MRKNDRLTANTKKSRDIGITLSYLYFVLNTVIGIFMSAFIIRTVGKTNYGVYQSVAAFINYLVLLEFGTGTIMARNISLCKKDGTDTREVQKNVSTVWTLAVVLSVAICLMSLVFWLMLDTIYANSMTPDQILLGKKLFIFAVISLVSSFLTNTLNGLILGYEFYTFEKSVSLVRLILRSTLVVILLTASPSVLLLVALDATLSVAAFLCSLLFCIIKIRVRFAFRYFDKAIFRMIVPLAIAMLLQTIVNTANGSVDKFLISVMMTPEDVAVYSVAMSIFAMFSGIATLPVTVFMPQIAHEIREGAQGRQLTEALVPACRLNILITGAVAFGFLSVGLPFVQAVYGEDYAPAWLFAVAVMLPMFFNMFNAVVENILDVLRKRMTRSLILMITTGLNILLTVVGIRVIGMLGAALATGISTILQMIILNIYYQKKIGLSIGLLIKESFAGFMPWLLLATLAATLVRSLFRDVLPQLFVGGITFVAVFGVCFLLFGANEDEKSKVGAFLRRVLKR